MQEIKGSEQKLPQSAGGVGPLVGVGPSVGVGVLVGSQTQSKSAEQAELRQAPPIQFKSTGQSLLFIHPESHCGFGVGVGGSVGGGDVGPGVLVGGSPQS